MGERRGGGGGQQAPRQQRQGGRRPRGPAAAPLRFTHAEVVAQLVDYHFGRLPREVNVAIETHIDLCAQCQREGLGHAQTEQRRAQRELKRVRGGKSLFSRRGRLIILILGVLALGQITALALTQGSGVALARLFGGGGHAGAASAVATAAPLLRAQTTFSPQAMTTAALALSPDGRTLAAGQIIGANQAGTHATLTFWDTTTDRMMKSVAWPNGSPPQTLAWSPDGQTLAAVDGQTLFVWSVAQNTLLWQDPLPSGQAMLVYSAPGGAILAQPDPTALFAPSAFAQWGANGALAPAPSGAAGAPDVAPLDGPLVSPWHTGSVHLFATVATGTAGKVGVLVGDDLAHATGQGDILSWSPDAQYLVWGRLALPVAVAPASGAPTTTATSGLTPPDPAAVLVAKRLLESAQAQTPRLGVQAPDASLWFSPSASALAVCQRSGQQAGAPTTLVVFSTATGNALAQQTGGCGSQSGAALAWTPSGQAMYYISQTAAITLYRLP